MSDFDWSSLGFVLEDNCGDGNVALIYSNRESASLIDRKIRAHMVATLCTDI